MKKLLLASVIAIGMAAAMVGPADANVFLGGSYFGFGPFGDFYDSYGPYPFYGPYWGGPYYDSGGHDDGGRYYGAYPTRHVAPHGYYAYHHRHCRIETVGHRSHHHWVRRNVRVCGY
jgi:hypothetical protein